MPMRVFRTLMKSFVARRLTLFMDKLDGTELRNGGTRIKKRIESIPSVMKTGSLARGLRGFNI